jgi:hypothetical protein
LPMGEEYEVSRAGRALHDALLAARVAIAYARVIASEIWMVEGTPMQARANANRVDGFIRMLLSMIARSEREFRLSDEFERHFFRRAGLTTRKTASIGFSWSYPISRMRLRAGFRC